MTIVFTFLPLDVFDSTGTLIGIAQRAGFLDAEGHFPRLKKTLIADSGSTMVGAMLGTSTATAYIESAAATMPSRKTATQKTGGRWER